MLTFAVLFQVNQVALNGILKDDLAINIYIPEANKAVKVLSLTFHKANTEVKCRVLCVHAVVAYYFIYFFPRVNAAFFVCILWSIERLSLQICLISVVFTKGCMIINISELGRYSLIRNIRSALE